MVTPTAATLGDRRLMGVDAPTVTADAQPAPLCHAAPGPT
jgi:hypothetical protein